MGAVDLFHGVKTALRAAEDRAPVTHRGLCQVARKVLGLHSCLTRGRRGAAPTLTPSTPIAMSKISIAPPTVPCGIGPPFSSKPGSTVPGGGDQATRTHNLGTIASALLPADWTAQGRAFDFDQSPVRELLRGPMKALLPPTEWLQPAPKLALEPCYATVNGRDLKSWTR